MTRPTNPEFGSGETPKGVEQKMKMGVLKTVIRNLKGDVAESVASPEANDREQKMLTALSDAINESPEKIKNALRFYDSGEYSRKHSYESREAIKIIKKIRKAKTQGKLDNVVFDYMGGTDGLEHKAIRNQRYHEKKAAALKRLLAFYREGHLEITLTLDEAKIALIEQYIEAVKDEKGYEFIKAHNDDFREGGQILDAALALQRAQNMMRRIEGRGKELDEKTQFLRLILNQKEGQRHRKSGFFFSKVSEKNEELVKMGKKEVPEGKILLDQKVPEGLFPPK